jgi:hypothetical protein
MLARKQWGPQDSAILESGFRNSFIPASDHNIHEIVNDQMVHVRDVSNHSSVAFSNELGQVDEHDVISSDVLENPIKSVAKKARCKSAAKKARLK